MKKINNEWVRSHLWEILAEIVAREDEQALLDLIRKSIIREVCRKAGSTKSDRKSRASRENGKRGGRPSGGKTVNV